MKSFENSKMGGAMIKDERKFYQNDGKVLKFYVQTDELYVMHYYLSDDTVEIKEQHSLNSGRDSFPLFL